MKEAFDVYARGLAFEAQAVQTWLQLGYLLAYRDPLSRNFNPQLLLDSLQPHLDHMEALLLLGSRFTHLPNYLEADLPSVNAAIAQLKKLKNTTIPQGMLSFAGQRAAANPGEVIGE